MRALNAKAAQPFRFWSGVMLANALMNMSARNAQKDTCAKAAKLTNSFARHQSFKTKMDRLNANNVHQASNANGTL